MDYKNDEILSELEARKRDHKVYITEQAIQKVPYIEYREINKKHYENLQELARHILRLSKDMNDSNEVAAVYSLDLEALVAKNEDYVGIAYGTEHEVDPEGSTASYHIIHSALDCVVVCLHNHPNLSKFSLDDVKFFLRNDSVKMMVVVTNLGRISYLVKGSKFNRIEAIGIYNEAVRIHNLGMDLKNAQKAADYFMKECYRADIIYEDR